MILREERPADHTAVDDVTTRAFGADHGPVVTTLLRSLRETGNVLSLVAELDEKVVGHALFSYSLLDAPKKLVDVPVLSPISVEPELHKQGIGSALIKRGLELLTERNDPVVFLEGDPRYYQRFGFVPGGEQDFRKPSLRIPDPCFMARKLPAHEPWMTGTLVYAAPFWQHDCVGLRDQVSTR